MKRLGIKASETTYVNGEKVGIDHSWYEDGSKEYKTNVTYKKKCKFTLFTRWYKNGKKQSEYRSKDNQREGAWIFWYDSGEKERHELWEKAISFHQKSGIATDRSIVIKITRLLFKAVKPKKKT